MSDPYRHKFLSWKSVFPMITLWLLVILLFALLEYCNIVSVNVLLWIMTPLWICFAFNFLHSIIRLIWAVRTFRAHLRNVILRMARIFRRFARAKYEIAKILGYVFLAFTVSMLFFILELHVAIPLILFFVSVAIIVMVRALIPPAVILLTSSAPDRLRLFQRLQIRAITGITAMLDTSQHIQQDAALKKMLFRSMIIAYDARTSNDANWEVTAKEIMDIVPTILLDSRETSPGVLYEAERIFSEKLWFKTLFIVGEDDSCPAVDLALEKTGLSRPDIYLLTEENLIGAFIGVSWLTGRYWVPRYENA